MSVPSKPNSFRTGPDERGHFGIYGGRFVAETLMPLVLELEQAYAKAKADPAFQKEMDGYLTHYVGRPSPLYFAERLTEHLRGAKIYFKREELNHTGAHKVNNVLGQIMVARRMGKKRIIAETGAGMHGVATATLCARFGLQCIVYMGAVDVDRQRANVFRMRMLGAEVRPVQSGTRTLKDAMNEALRDWVTNVADTFYCIGTVAGPHPYPMMVRDFQCVIGRETREQMQEAEGRLPDSLVACIGGGSNAMGLFHPFLDDGSVEIYGVEAAGHGLTGLHAASIAGGRPGVLHGNRTYLLMDEDGQIKDAHSISAGLDYPGIGPEHAWLNDMGRVKFMSATDDEAVAALQLCSRLEGIIPALEPAHALAKVIDIAPTKPKDHLMVVNVSGRGDKDLELGRAISRRQAMTTRIERRFAALTKEGRAALVTFTMAGDPDHDISLAILKALPKAGADLLEIGMPFTDPMADGPAIQAAGLRALKSGQTLKKTLAMVREFRTGDDDTPIVLMGYYNPIYIYGVDRFLVDAKAVGVDGLIVVDLPPEEDDELCVPALKAGLNFIRLATPTTDDKRLPAVLANTSGFVYYVSITGITGSATPDANRVAPAVARIKRHCKLPVAVGFGVRTAAQASEIARNADGVVVGSALVDVLRASLDANGKATAGTLKAVSDLVAELAVGVRSAKRVAAE